MADDARLAELRGLLAEQMWRDDSGSDKPLSSTGPGTQRTYARAASNLLPIVSAWAEQHAARRAAEAETALERVRALLQKAEWQEKHSIARMFDGAPFPVSISQHALRAALTPASEEKL